jgi:uncharacterized membrane protein
MPEGKAPGAGLTGDSSLRSPSPRKIILVYGLTAAGTLAWLAGIFLAPYLRAHNMSSAALIYALYSPVCHQLASRSFFAWGCPLAVCARCLGIYLGFAAGVASYPFVRGLRRVSLPSSVVFLLVSAPIVADTVGHFLRLWMTPPGLRLATGILWGTILPYYFITGFAELRLSRRR